mgnify:CR=1 FL=1
MKIAVDVMGGDLGPEPPIRGCVNFVRKTGLEVVIVGDEKIIDSVLSNEKQVLDKIEIAHTTQFVNMDDRISKVLRKKKLASISIAARLVKSGYCKGLFTIGNTAAAISWSNIVLRKLKGVKKAALCSILPKLSGFTILVDSGASLRCTGDNLYQFAEMGNVIAGSFFKKKHPAIGLINIGKEEGKGKFKIQRANYLLKKSGLNYIGYIEGNDLVSGNVDVAVCDGFIGNVLLKYSEGIFKNFVKINPFKDLKNLLKNIPNTNMKNITRLNGAPLLGVMGTVIVGHGSSDEQEFENGLHLTSLFLQAEINNKLEKVFAKKKYFENLKGREDE